MILFLKNCPIVLGLMVISLVSQGFVIGNNPVDIKHLNPIEIGKDSIPIQPSRKKIVDIVHTEFNLSFDWEKQQVHGMVIITFTPHFQSVNTVTFDAVGFEIQKIALITDTIPLPLIYTYNSKQIRMNLPKIYSFLDTLSVSIAYIADPNSLVTKKLIENPDEKGLFFINPDSKEEGVPRQIWTQNQTDFASCWFPTINSPNQRMSQDMYITVSDKYTVISNGELIYSTLNKDSTRTWYWKQELPHPPYLTALVVGTFATFIDHWKDKDITYYADPQYEPYLEKIFANTPEMIEFFSNTFGVPFPWEKYSMVAVHQFVAGGMENSSCVILGDFIQGNFRNLKDYSNDALIAHELSHHWFGNLVTCESWSNITLNEAFASYAEYLWADYKYGRDESQNQLNEMKADYLFEAEFKQEQLIRFHYENASEDLFDSHSYSKGALILHVLRWYIGDKAFFEGIKRYLQKYAFSSVEVHNLRLVFEEVTGEDLNWFFDQWFFSKGHPELTVNWTFDPLVNTVTVTIEQQPGKEHPSFTFLADLEIYIGLTKNSQPVFITNEKMEISFPCQKKPDLIWLNMEKTPVSETRYCNKNDFSLLYRDDNSFFSRYQALVLCEQDTSSQSISLAIKSLTDKHWKIRLMALEKLNDRFGLIADSSVLYQLRLTIPAMAQNDPEASVRAEAVALLSSFSGEDIDAILLTATNDSSYYVSRIALKCLIHRNPVKGFARATEYEQSSDPNVLINIAMIYSYNGKGEHNDFFIRTLHVTSGTTKLSILNYYVYFLKNCSDSLQSVGFDAIYDMAPTTQDPRVLTTAVNCLRNIRLWAFNSLNQLELQTGNVYDPTSVQNGKEGAEKKVVLKKMIENFDQKIVSLVSVN